MSEDPTDHIITVDATNAKPDGESKDHDLEYTDTINGKTFQGHRIYVTEGDTVQWKVSLGGDNSSNVHLFILFPPGEGPFASFAFHATTTTPTLAQTITPIQDAPQEFEYFVAVIDERYSPSPPTVYTDDPVIHHSGSSTVDQYLEDALAAVPRLYSATKASKIETVIKKAIEEVRRIQKKDL
jgi:hypothetical protein